jgi:putative oxidoreductase
MDFIRFFSKYEAQFYAILRMMAGFLFLWHGSQKLFNIPAPPVPPGGALPTQIILAGIIEFAGGILIMLGLLTRWAALFCCLVMAVAYLTVHAPQSFLPLVNQGESSLFYFFLFSYFLLRGSGIWSLDHLIHKPLPVSGNNSPHKDIPVQ